MTSERLVFEKIREDRGRYYVEYHPPITSFRFATLNIVFPEDSPPEKVANTMEAEVPVWLMRFPVPIMASAFDASDHLCDLESVRPCDHLLGLLDDSGAKAKLFWRLLKDTELPEIGINTEYLKTIYSGVPYKTSSELKQAAHNLLKQRRVGWIIVFSWAALVPAIWAIVEWAGPNWLALVVLFYSFWKATVKALKLLGKWKKSPREIEKEEDQRKMKHHHYHCQRNPDGFLRLKLENFEREAKARIQEEARDLKLKRSTDKHS